MTTENQLLREWRIDYENDTGNDDGAFWEWWTLTDGVRSFKCDSEADAQWLQAALTQPAQPAEGGEAVYQCQGADGRWTDQSRDSYDYNVKHGGGPVRVLYTAPPASQEQAQQPSRGACGIMPLVDDYAKAVHDGDDAMCQVLRRTIEASLQQPSGGEVPGFLLFSQRKQIADDAGVQVTADTNAVIAATLRFLRERATPKPEPMTWRDIETAPKDGAEFLGWRHGRIATARLVPRDDCEMWVFGGESFAFEVFPALRPTHWMPLPPAPITKGEA